MVEELSIVLAASIPTFIYCFIIWMTLPYKSVSIRQTVSYLGLGFLSITLLKLMWYFFPEYFSTDWSIPFLHDEQTNNLYTLAFFKVGYPEEIGKALAFLFIFNWMKFEFPKEKVTPIGMMFYCGITALSFGMLENILYATNYGIDVLFPRTFTSLIFHFFCGLTIGYWAAMAEQKFEGGSMAGYILNENPNLKRIFYYIIGISIAAYVHGIYDFNFFFMGAYAYPLMFSVLGVYAFILYVASKHLITLTNNNK